MQTSTPDAGSDGSDRSTSTPVDDLLAESYSRLQFVIGALAILLPIVVALGDWLIDDHPLRGSISSYYYGRTGGYFIGSLCAIGVFLFSYNYRPRPGHDQDNLLSNVAAIAVIGVALFPTASTGADATGGARVVAYVHVLCAAVFFFLLAVLALFYFTRVNARSLGLTGSLRLAIRDQDDTSPSRARDNRIYRICGWTIVASLVAIVINNLLDAGLLFWLECVIVWAFGVAWLRKSARTKIALGLVRR